MSDPSLALQKAVRAALLAAPAVTTLIMQRVYDRVPPSAVFPYVVIPDDQILDDGNTCSEDSSEAFIDVHIWARDRDDHPIKGAAYAKEIGGAVRAALATKIPVEGQRTIVGNFETARNVNDPDGITAHRIIGFRYLLDPV